MDAPADPPPQAATAPPSQAATAAPPPAPARATGVELLGEMQGSGYRRSPALVRRRDGEILQLTPLLYALLAAVDGRRDHAELATLVGQRVGRSLAAEDAAWLVEAKLRPLGLLEQPDGSQPAVAKASPLLALRCKYVVTDPARTQRITRPFALLFRPPVAVAILVAFAATVWWVLFDKGLASATHEAFHDPRLLLLVVGLTVLSAAFHEFGHAAACRYGGATPGAMGAGLYLVWPVFYTEVTDSYRLGRRGRLRVDVGGLYFNAVFTVAVMAVWWPTRSDALLLLVATQVLQMLRQLTPLVRFDGYHILADLTGVPDLFHHIRPTLAGLLPTRRRQTSALKRWARAVVTVWVLIVVPALATVLTVLVGLLPRIVATAWSGITTQRVALSAGWAAGELAEVAVRLLSMATLAIPVASVIYLLVRIARRTLRRALRFARRDSRRGAITALAAAALLGAAAVAWWPQGQYEPVEPSERGVLTDVFRLALPTPAGGADPGDGRRHGEPRARRLEVPPLADATPPTPQPVDAAAADTEVADRPEADPDVADVEPAAARADETAAARADETAPDTSSEASNAAGTPRPPWPFSFDPPAEPEPDDNRAQVANVRDGAAVVDVSIDAAWVIEGDDVTRRNEAYAYAQCLDCRTRAVAFQAVFVVGSSDVVTPGNAAVAANERCERCDTFASAVQLVATLDRMPDQRTAADLERVLRSLERLHGTARTATPEDIAAQLTGAKGELLRLLDEADLLVDDTGEAAQAGADAEDHESDADRGAGAPQDGDGNAETEPADANADAESSDEASTDDGVPDDAANDTNGSTQDDGTPQEADGSTEDDGTPQEADGSTEDDGAAQEADGPTEDDGSTEDDANGATADDADESAGTTDAETDGAGEDDPAGAGDLDGTP